LETELTPERKRTQSIGRLLWDLLMVCIVFINISLIAFSLTYFWLRPFYFFRFPGLVKYYDSQILGIEQHRVTDAYLKLIQKYKKLVFLEKEENRIVELTRVLTDLEKILKKISTENATSNSFAQKIKLFKELLQLSESVEKYKNVQIVLEQLDTEIHSIKKTTLTDQYENLRKDFLTVIHLSEAKGTKEEFESLLLEMDRQIILIVSSNPFLDSGQTPVYKEIQKRIKEKYEMVWTIKIDKEYRELLKASNSGQHIPSTAVAFSWFWRNPSLSIQEKFKQFDQEFHPLFAINYYRNIGLSGKHIDNFYLLEAPFLVFFLLEFMIRWIIAIRQKTYIAWFLYPLYHWYDVLGLIPLAEFRLFRLIRIYTMYQILKESEFTKVGDDIISRTIKYYSSIVKEELSDMVTIQILSEAQAEVKSGTSMEIFTNAIDSKRSDIKKVVISKLQSSLAGERMERQFQKIFDHVLTKTGSNLNIQGIIPKEFVTQIALAFFQALTSVITTILQEENTKESVEAIVDIVIDEMVETSKDPELNKLNESITIELLENIKKSVAVKKWVDTQI
jgi:hypothetical protein